MKKLIVKILAAGAVSLFNIHQEAMACSACFGNPDKKMSQGIFAAVYVLLGVVIFVLGGIAWTGVTWAKRAKNLESRN